MIPGWSYRTPLTLLQDLGITEPEEIDIEAIAQYCRATIQYKPLEGCQARIIGYGNRAIIAVSSSERRARQRFSGAHELGHWMCDHNHISFSCSEKELATEWSKDNPERRANRYAADLLLPEFMFRPRSKDRDITFDTVHDLASQFNMSLTATAIRLVEFGSFPSIIVCNDKNKLRWFSKDRDLPSAIRLRDRPGRATIAYDLLHGAESPGHPVDVYADSWIDREDADRYSIREDSIRISLRDGLTLVVSLLWWKDERQLLDLELQDET